MTRRTKRRGLVSRTLGAVVVAACLMSMASATIVAQPRTPAAQDEFVPVDELPPEDEMPAAPLLIGAYAIVWLLVLGYTWSLWRRLGRVEADLTALRDRLSRGAR